MVRVVGKEGALGAGEYTILCLLPQKVGVDVKGSTAAELMSTSVAPSISLV